MHVSCNNDMCINYLFCSHVSEMDKREDNDRRCAENPSNNGYSNNGETDHFSRPAIHHPRRASWSANTSFDKEVITAYYRFTALTC